MKKLFLLFFMVLAFNVTAPAYAANVNCDDLSISGLPDAAVIELKKKCVEVIQKTTPVSVSEVSEYAELGKKYGIALSEVAKSIGTTVNELAQTPVGKFMLVMVAYKVMGEDLIGVVGGIIWFSTMIPLWIFMFYRLVLSTRKITETIDPKTNEVTKTITPVDYNGDAGIISIILLVVLGLICICGFFMVFG